MPKPNFDKIFVVDLELTTCDYPEIIEIGICDIDVESLKISKGLSIFVRPDNSRPDAYCTQLTGITWDNIKTAPPLVGACNKLIKKMGTKNRTWASWGAGDLIGLKNECDRKNIPFPFGNNYIDISNLYSIVLNNSKRVNLQKAICSLNSDFVGRPHSGVDDAINAARILKILLSSARNIIHTGVDYNDGC